MALTLATWLRAGLAKDAGCLHRGVDGCKKRQLPRTALMG